MPLRRLLQAVFRYAILVVVLLVSSTSAGSLVSPALAREIPGPDDVNPAPVVPKSTPGPSATAVAGAMITASPILGAASDPRAAQLRQSIDIALDGLNGDWAVAIQDLASDETLLVNADRPYPAASQYKLLLLYEAYRRIEAGELDLGRMTTMIEADYADSLKWDEELHVGNRVSVKGLLRVLVIQSSNAAAHALERLIGGTNLNAVAQDLGLEETHMPTASDATRYDDWRAELPSTSVRDLQRFYVLLYRSQLVSKRASEAMLMLLKEQQINDRIPALLPRGVEVAHKTGNLPGVVNDAGIIFGPRRDVLLAVLNNGADHDEATAAIAKVAIAVYNWYNR